MTSPRRLGGRGTIESSGAGGCEGLLLAAAEFFHTSRPFDLAEMIEIFEFIAAADISKERNGAEVVGGVAEVNIARTIARGLSGASAVVLAWLVSAGAEQAPPSLAVVLPEGGACAAVTSRAWCYSRARTSARFTA